MRLAYLSGPIDAALVYRNAAQQGYFGTIYLAQLYQRCAGDMLVITTLPGAGFRRQIDRVSIVNIPMPTGKSGAAYHLAMIGWALRCMVEIVRFRPGAALLTAGQDYFWIFGALRLFGVRLLTSLHCALWPKLAKPKLQQRVFAKLNGLLFFPACDHIQGFRDAIAQIRSVSRKLRAEPKLFLPTYERQRFASVVPPELSSDRFNLLYVGRLEANKGVLDLLAIMRQLEAAEPGKYVLDICGEGSVALPETKTIRLHGQCGAAALLQRYAECHAVIVPTRSNFEEGYAKTAAEAVINLRPLITSAAVPALEDVRAAAMEAETDNVASYVQAVRALANGPELYAAKVRAAGHCREIYFDSQRSYGATLRPVLDRLADRPDVVDRARNGIARRSGEIAEVGRL